MKSKILVFIVLLAVAGCGKKSIQISNFPMIQANEKQGPWIVKTYSGDKVKHESVRLDGKQIVKRSETVYLSSRSQFVYRDGTPIEIFTGEKIYWNNQGYVITKKMRHIPEDTVFVVNGDPMKRNTPLMLHDFNKSL